MHLKLISAIFLLTVSHGYAQTAFGVANGAQMLPAASFTSMRSSLTSMLSKLTVATPGGRVCPQCNSQCGLNACLTKNLQGTVKPIQGKTTRAQLGGLLKANGLPQAAINKLNAIIFAESVIFQTFDSRINVNTAQGILMEVVGAARRKGDTVEFGVLMTNVHLSMIRKVTIVNKRSCKRFLFIKKCKNRQVHVARGYTAPELADIEKTMLSRSNQLMKGAVNQIQVFTAANLPIESEMNPYVLSTRSKQSLKEAIKKFIDRFPFLKALLEKEETSTNVTIRKITDRGFMDFSRSATLQAIDNVDPSMYESFVGYALRILNINSDKVEDAVKKQVFDMVPLATNSDWIMYRILFQEQTGGCKYVCVLGHNNQGKGYDFVFATFSMKFELAPDLLVIEESKSAAWGMVKSSKTRIVQIPRSLKYDDIDTLFKFFDLATFTRFAKMVDVAMPTSFAVIDQSYDAMAIIGAVQAGVKLWGEIAKTFKTKITNKIVDKIIGEGFSKFFMNSVAHRVEGLQAGFLSRYLEMAPRMYNIPEKYKGEFRDVMLLATFTNAQQWNKQDMLFDASDSGSNRWITILSNRQSDGNYNFLIVNVAQTFVLAPDILVIEQSKSVAGGIYESTKIKFQRMPKNLTEKDMKQLFAFFTVVTFQRFAAAMGMEIPDDPKLGQ